MVKTVYIIIGCDADQDRPNFIGDIPKDRPGWVGLLEGIPRAKEFSSKVCDTGGNPPIFSWCLRVDDQIRHYYDDCAWVLKEHHDFLKDLSDSGDELAWHPHFWRFDESGKKWFQEIDDRPWQKEMLGKAFDAYRAVFSEFPQTVRMGWNYHNSDSMAALSDLGIKIDFSAVPGMKLEKTSARHDNIYDWYESPRLPYHPSRDDYLKPSGQNEALPIIEIPNLISRSFWWGMVAGLVLSKKMRSIRPALRALKRPRYLINITADRKYFRPILIQFRKDIRSHRQENFIFNSYFHADEMAENSSNLYSVKNFAVNLKDILAVIERAGASAKFIKASDAADILTDL